METLLLMATVLTLLTVGLLWVALRAVLFLVPGGPAARTVAYTAWRHHRRRHR